ncbi:MAG: hypothetical protein IKN27_09845 [Selenomonadaceae bacterium]|nr:hypothetical protein [Selenomonadaceae bacterium]
MKRPIKFRGRDKETGKIVFGSFVDYGEHCNSRYWINPPTNEANHPVDPDSVAQLVGYDANGKEIYEGDKVVSEYGDEIVARLMDNLPPKAKLKEPTK